MSADAGDSGDGRGHERQSMITTQIVARGVQDPRTLEAMRLVPRHLFIPQAARDAAYRDHPVPIGHGQTISQPYVVAFMTEALALKGGETVLEIGAGCGYQSAVLSKIAAHVFAIEIVPSLAEETQKRLADLGYSNVEVRSGDGYAGWPEKGPFDAILVAAAAPRMPETLKRQLRDGGRMIVPVGDYAQDLLLVTREGNQFRERPVLNVRFVPMTGAIRTS